MLLDIACWAVLAIVCLASGLFLTCYAINGLVGLWQCAIQELIEELEQVNEPV